MTARLRRTAGVASLGAVALTLAACGTSGSSSNAGPGGPTTTAGAPTAATTSASPLPSAPAKVSGTVQLWHFFTGREAKAIDAVVADFEKAYPDIKVVVKSGQDDTKATQAISAGKGPDVDLSYSTDITGKFCSSGAFRDLGPYIARDKVDLSQIPQSVQSYTEYKGVRCEMPFLADTYGLYYNKTMLAAAGYTSPPKTMSELTTMAEKLTKRNADGSIKVAGFVPTVGYYENAPAHYAPTFGATWLKPDGTSNIGTDKSWQPYLSWIQTLTKFYGQDKLAKFVAGAGQEFSADNDFEKGKVAMMIDGEYRNAFITSEHPELSYATAPFPTADDKTNLYGGGYVTGNIIGIGKGAKNPEAAWVLIKYLTSDTAAMVKLANGIKNVPTWNPALNSPDLVADANFKTFLDVFASPNTATTPASPNGGAYQVTFQNWIQKWQTGKAGTDLQGGLNSVDKQINDALKLGTAP
ncbi:MAG: multiple sugar transport system substrate-binding protein [Frankiales bacterium]|nr:multiple sugar transport system substrate-binding protein [Frankiales bacterium]